MEVGIATTNPSARLNPLTHKRDLRQLYSSHGQPLLSIIFSTCGAALPSISHIILIMSSSMSLPCACPMESAMLQQDFTQLIVLQAIALHSLVHIADSFLQLFWARLASLATCINLDMQLSGSPHSDKICSADDCMDWFMKVVSDRVHVFLTLCQAALQATLPQTSVAP